MLKKSTKSFRMALFQSLCFKVMLSKNLKIRLYFYKDLDSIYIIISMQLKLICMEESENVLEF